jgi:Uncharacterized conserved protein
MFELGKYLADFVFPPGIFLVFCILLIALIALEKKKAALLLACISACALYLFSITPIADSLILPLEKRYQPFDGKTQVEAIVVLGGGSVLHSPEFDNKAALINAGLARAAYGARLSRQLNLPIIYTGGTVMRKDGTESEAEAAMRFFEGIGIPQDRVRLEAKSRDTSQNARFVASMVGKGKIVLVTSAFHMPRSVLAFKKAGIDAVPAPTDYRCDREPYRLIDFMPSADSLAKSTLALHEYVGLLYYSMTM